MKNKFIETIPEFNSIGEVDIIYKRKIKSQDQKIISDINSASEVLRKIYDFDKIEHKEFFYCLFLARNNKLLAALKISEGGISGTVVDLRNIFQAALLLNASSIIVSHNHPSGNLKPSEQDKRLTDKIKNAGLVMDIALIDHIIITPSGETYSMLN